MLEKIKKFSLLQKLTLAFFLFLPFERLLTFDLFGFTAKISFAILLAIIGIYLGRRSWPTLERGEKYLLLFSVWVFVTSLWSFDITRTLFVAIIFLAVVVGYFFIRRLLKPEIFVVVEKIIIYFSVLLALFALYQYFGDMFGLSTKFSLLRSSYTKAVFGFPRPQATFLEPLYFGNYLILPIFFLFRRLAIRKFSWGNFSILVLILVAFVLTLSRGAYLALASGLLLIALYILIKNRQLWKKLLLIFAALFASIFVAVGIIYFTAGSGKTETFVGHATVDDATTGESTLGRMDTIKLALRTFSAHSFGIGAGAFGSLPEFDLNISKTGYQTANNFYSEILAEEGFPGAIFFLVFLYFTIAGLAKKTKRSGSYYIFEAAILLAFLVQAMTFSTLYILPLWAMFALISRDE